MLKAGLPYKRSTRQFAGGLLLLALLVTGAMARSALAVVCDLHNLAHAAATHSHLHGSKADHYHGEANAPGHDHSHGHDHGDGDGPDDGVGTVLLSEDGEGTVLLSDGDHEHLDGAKEDGHTDGGHGVMHQSSTALAFADVAIPLRLVTPLIPSTQLLVLDSQPPPAQPVGAPFRPPIA